MSEPIPGMANRVRESVKSLVGYRSDLIDPINNIPTETIYQHGPQGAIERVAHKKPTDSTDFRQWREFLSAADAELGPKVIREWAAAVRDAFLAQREAA